MDEENTSKLDRLKEEIERFRKQLGANPAEQIKSGSWFSKLLQMVLNEHAQKVNGEYFRRKYPGVDSERLAHRLVKNASNYAGISGSLAAGAVTASELSSVVSFGTSLGVLGGSILTELSYTTYLQLKMIYDISVVLEADLDKDDPEDILTIFWLVLGVNVWENVANLLFFETGPRAASYLGRKALRSGIRKALQLAMAKLGGQQLARKLTEKSMLKVIGPGVNVPIAYFGNKSFTVKLGDVAIKRLKHRALVIKPTKKLLLYSRYLQLLAIPMINYIGIEDEPKKEASKALEMLHVVSRRLKVQDEEDQILGRIHDNFEDFLLTLKDVDHLDAAKALRELGICAYLVAKNTKESLNKLKRVGESLGLPIDETELEQIKKKLNK